MYQVHAPIVPKLAPNIRTPRIKNQKSTARPLKTVIKVSFPKSSRVPKNKLRPLIIHEPGEPYFTGPITPKEAIEKYGFLLNRNEVLELSDFEEIYYIRQDPPKSKPSSRTVPNFFSFVPNDHVAYRYQQQEVLGKGSFGTVIKCIDHKTGRQVAIKFLRDKKKVHKEILFENSIIEKLQDNDTNNESNIIKYIDSFKFRGFFCIVMELLWKDTYTVLESRRFIGFGASTIRMVAYETAKALKYMHERNVVHCDIKPENIMFRNSKRQGIKVIDFGCSCEAGKIIFNYVQSRFYRAPEVVLGMDYNKEIDVWSLGCVLCELVTGKPLFDAESQLELLQMITEMFGDCPNDMIEHGIWSKFYIATKDQNGNIKYRLKLSASRKSQVIPNSTTLAKETNITSPGFIDLVTSCLKWRPSERITPEEIMKNDWVLSKSH